MAKLASPHYFIYYYTPGVLTLITLKSCIILYGKGIYNITNDRVILKCSVFRFRTTD